MVFPIKKLKEIDRVVPIFVKGVITGCTLLQYKPQKFYNPMNDRQFTEVITVSIVSKQGVLTWIAACFSIKNVMWPRTILLVLQIGACGVEILWIQYHTLNNINTHKALHHNI